MKQNNISSEDFSVKDIVDQKIILNIPIYQRLYVWREEQIKTLLADLYTTFSNGENKFYLGGVLLSPGSEKHHYDLVDGQQRFTTLWLISKVLNNSELNNFVSVDDNNEKKPRITFPIRDYANDYLKNYDKYKDYQNENGELEQLIEAVKIIDNFVKYPKEENKADDKVPYQLFSEFIYEKVHFIVTIIPNDSDENKIFEVMNNRGVQLQQHEILKNKLLSYIDPKERTKYGVIWDSCSSMDKFIEKSFKEVSNLTWKDIFTDVNKELNDDFFIYFKNNNSEGLDSKSLSKIIEIEKDLEFNNEENHEETYEEVKVRSIITFPMLLLHVLRIFQFRNKFRELYPIPPVKSKELIKIFKEYFFCKIDKLENKQDKVKEFIELLWKIRLRFDKYVIKWWLNENDETEYHEIMNLNVSVSNNNFSINRFRTTANDGFELLQSMLYHSQELITFYWLTPFLNKMLDEKSEEKLYQYLEKVDNYMFCSKSKFDLSELSFEVMGKEEVELVANIEYVLSHLHSHLGTGYASYWFYKLEYILWINNPSRKSTLLNIGWKDYKLTSKNSVEHIFPQNPKIVNNNNPDEEFSKEQKDDFGNLVLLSVGMNSEYGNKSFIEKKVHYESKKRLDSLKSDLIFSNGKWRWKNCEKHRNEMIEIFQKHLEKNHEL